VLLPYQESQARILQPVMKMNILMIFWKYKKYFKKCTGFIIKIYKLK